ncbi:hypothetical protein KOR42_33150 [Thalassoglobus neptunius]|uniref:Uncharacterized protein n=1 Tax=Thalassoglobus neptunius TaxID=1938619 RepID=A0A5C5WPV7_9PLAN|nr:hypothetical protein [Thalassoglobus neptunius]TWT51842.1 hypothetical protein KOR42_33150 [Thalassoglobus neptunius]
MANPKDIEAGSAYVRIFTKDGELHAGLTKGENRLRAFSRTMLKTGTILSGSFIAAAAAIAPAVSAASNLEEQVNKFNVVFGESSEAVREWAKEFGEAIGRSERQVVEFLAGTQDLFVPLGFDSKEAERLSKDLTRLTIDLASFNNKADEDVLRDLHAALTGSGEVMKKYGVIVSEAAVKQEIFNQGLDPKNATEQQKVQARLAIILRGTSAAHGDAARSAGSWANQTKALQAEIENLYATIGAELLPILTPLVGDIREIVKASGEWAENNGETIETLVKLAGVAGVAGSSLIAIGLVASNAAASFKALRFILIDTSKVAAALRFGVLIGGLTMIGKAAYDSSEQVKRLNAELAKSSGLDRDLQEIQSRRTGKILEEANKLEGDERTRFLQDELAKTEASIDGTGRNLRDVDEQLSKELESNLRAGVDMVGWNSETTRLRGERVSAATRLESYKDRRRQLKAMIDGPEAPQGPQFEIPQIQAGPGPQAQAQSENGLAKAFLGAWSPVISEAAQKIKEEQDKQIRALSIEGGLQGLGMAFPALGMGMDAARAIQRFATAGGAAPAQVESITKRIQGAHATEAGTSEAQRIIAQALSPRATEEKKQLDELTRGADATEALGTIAKRVEDLFAANKINLLFQDT